VHAVASRCQAIAGLHPKMGSRMTDTRQCPASCTTVETANRREMSSSLGPMRSDA